ncbi:MAG: hypothetical protein KC776_33415 [Myxococcales bacterium]|nr:hypothetical protein [Myxococcales bacterium]
MGRGAELWAALDAVYLAALDESHWPAALRCFTELCGGAGATLELHHRPTRELAFFRDEGMPEDGVALYTDHYHSVCPRLPWGRTDPVGAPIYDYRFLTEAEMRRLEFYEDFLALHDFRYVVGGIVANHDDHFGLVAVHRTVGAGHADDETIGTMKRLLPHLARALEVQQRLRAARVFEQGFGGALENMTVGVVLLSAAGRVLFANESARRLLSGDRGVVIERGSLSGRTTEEQAVLARLRREGGAYVADKLGEHPLSLVAAALPRALPNDWLLTEPAGATCVLFVQDPSSGPILHDAVLRDAYQLTPAEIRLARALVGGATLSEDAAERRVSMNTARTQLKRLRAKLGARSQSDLVSRLSRLMPPVTQTGDDAMEEQGVR